MTLCLPLAGLILLGSAHATPEKAARYYENALDRFENNDVPGAVIQLKNALQEDRRMLAAHLLLGKALFKYGDMNGAQAAFEEALRQGVSRAEVVLPLGQVYMALGRPEMVIEQISATGLPPALQVEVLTLRGNAYFESGSNRLAAKSFEEARALDPKSAAPLIAEIPMLLDAGQSSQAAERAEKAVELAPRNASAWNMKASVLHASLDMSGALAAYDKALALDPKHVDARVARASLYIDLQRDADARDDLAFLQTAAPDEPRASYLRALLAAKQGNSEAVPAALADVTRVIDALPPAWLARREQLLMTGALAHHGLGNPQKAREYLNMILARNGRNLGAKKLLASIYIDTHDYGRALTLLEPLSKSVPDDPQVMFMLGSVHMAQRRYMQASDLLEKAAARTGAPEMNRALAYNQIVLGRNELGQQSLEKMFSANPADIRAGMTLSQLYMRQGQTQKALQVAEAMVKADTANLSALNFLGSTMRASGDLKGARSAYAQALEKDASFRPAILNLVRLDLSEKRFDEARKRLDALLIKQPDDHEALYEYGLLERRAGRIDEAVRRMLKAADVQRQDARPALALIDLYLSRRDPAKALEVAKTWSSRLPDDLPVQIALGRTLLASGDAGAALSVFTGAARLAEYDARTLVTIGYLQIQAGSLDGAAYCAQKALQGQPDDPAAMMLMVEIEAKRGDPAKADEALKMLSGKHPDRVETALATGHLALSRGQYPAAIAAFRKAVARQDSTANALALVNAYLTSGEAGKAVTFLEGWLKTRPNDLPGRKALAEAQFRSGHLQPARQSYAMALALAPDDAAMLNNYANLLQQLNDPTAQQMAEKAFALDPGNPSYADTLGWILVRKGQIDAGLRYLREARLRNPENAEIRFHLAYGLAKSGRSNEAREELLAALSGSSSLPENDLIRQLKKELGI
ncbi:MAG: PEP-CTERM system TPR-repeat protein PrsT [Propionivibrio sp.]